MKTIQFTEATQEIINLFANRNYKEAKDLYAQCMARVLNEGC